MADRLYSKLRRRVPENIAADGAFYQLHVNCRDLGIVKLYLVNHMDAPTKVAVYFEDLIKRCNRSGAGRPTELPLYDQYIFYVLSTRCEMDMNGFESVFDQLLEEPEIKILIAALKELRCTTLADAFAIARDRLADAGFFDDEEMMVCDLATDDGGFLDDIEERVRKDNLMWDLDESLAKLLPE